MSSIIGSSLRVTGMASGLDTDQLVKDLMSAEKAPLTKLLQKQTKSEWKRDAYRDVTNSLRAFKEKFFDVTKKTNYMLSDSTLQAFSAESSNSDYVTATATTDGSVGSHSVKVITLATADQAVSHFTDGNSVSNSISGTVSNFSLSGKKIQITLDGVTREIALADYSDLDDLVGDATNGLQKLLDDSFGTGKIDVQNNSGKLSLSTQNGASQLTVMSGTIDDGLASLGLSSGTTNRLSKTSSLDSLVSQLSHTLTFDSAGKVAFSINGASFSFDRTDSLEKVISTVNKSTTANVQMAYDESSDSFRITAKQTGAGDNIRLTETNSTFFSVMGISVTDPTANGTIGVDAEAEIDGVTVTRSSNSFSVNGVNYSLKKVHDTSNIEDTISISQDADKIFDSISSFVEDYNTMIEDLNSTLSEAYDRDYQPLTEDQKTDMSDDDIEKWEKLAKKGLLKNDSIIQDIVSDMRMAMINSIEGVGISLSSIGISSESYEDKGKLTIDENKLKAAIKENPNEIKNLFVQKSESESVYSRTLTSTERTTRDKEQGILYRISDIIDDQISIFRDTGGKKGALLEKAGIVNDASEYSSTISKELSSLAEMIDEMNDKLDTKEDNYYTQFSKLETYMNKMNAQMSWLTSQLGTSTSS